MQRPDLNGYYLINRGLRQEFGLLALAGRTARSNTHRELLEEQLQMCISLLDHHQREQDEWVFPALRERAPQAKAGLDNLKHDHAAIALLVNDVRDHMRSLHERAPTMQLLHERLNEHVSREERDAVPLILTHISNGEWEQSAKRVMNGIPHSQMPALYGWLASATPDDDVDQAMRILPRPARLLFRLMWNPAYQRRVQALYR